MARGCLIAAAVVLAVAAALAVLVGPTLYHEGKAFVEPVVEMARVEDTLKELDDRFPFTPPGGDAVIDEARLREFLDVRRRLEPLYRSWRSDIEVVEEEHRDSWKGAKMAVGSTRDVITGQVAALEAGRMSGAEFRWLEKVVYRRWLRAVQEAGLPIGGDEIRALTGEDLEFVASLERRYGRGPALEAMRERLEERLSAAGGHGGPEVPGIAPETLALLWRHREEIAELDLGSYELHKVLEQGTASGVHIN